MIARVLTIAGSDSGGGAGIEADIKTISALGGYACTAITAVTAQNTSGVYGIHFLPAAFVKLAIETVLGDIGADAIKIGMLGNAGIVRAVAAVLPEGVPVVLDPVMLSTSGAALLEPEGVALLRAELIPRAALVTPNLPETARLTGMSICTPQACAEAGRAILAMGARAALIKGGHGEGEMLIDFLVTADGVERMEHPRIAGRHTHGTGCTLASAIATGLAQGMGLLPAARRAERYLQRAIAAAPGFGAGHGPVWHGAPAL
jgi:hydroxymethylpyrimidine/phosphomethylpyrimidine kinase